MQPPAARQPDAAMTAAGEAGDGDAAPGDAVPGPAASAPGMPGPPMPGPARPGASRWQVSIGTARGAAHQASGQPNQDSAAQQTTASGGAVIVAIADGHGHHRHFRSKAGSALAVVAGCQAAAQLSADLSPDGSLADVDAAIRASLATSIVAAWRTAVAGQLAEHPYSAGEQAEMDRNGDDPQIPYGSTLLVAAVTGRWLICAQIGDGDLLAVQPHGPSFAPLPHHDVLDRSRTRSLCQADAPDAFRVGVHDLDADPLVAVLLATDGYGNAQAADAWQPGVGRDLARLAARHDPGWFARQVPDWAARCASADGSGDDTTIALLLHPHAAALAAGHSGHSGRAARTVPVERPPDQTVLALPWPPAAAHDQTLPVPRIPAAGPPAPEHPDPPAPAEPTHTQALPVTRLPAPDPAPPAESPPPAQPTPAEPARSETLPAERIPAPGPATPAEPPASSQPIPAEPARTQTLPAERIPAPGPVTPAEPPAHGQPIPAEPTYTQTLPAERVPAAAADAPGPTAPAAAAPTAQQVPPAGSGLTVPAQRVPPSGAPPASVPAGRSGDRPGPADHAAAGQPSPESDETVRMEASAPARDAAPDGSRPGSPSSPDTLPMPAEPPRSPTPKAAPSGSSRGPVYPDPITGAGSRRTGMFVLGVIVFMVLVAAGVLLFALRPTGSPSPAPARSSATASRSASPGASGHRPAGSGPAVTASPQAPAAGG